MARCVCEAFDSPPAPRPRPRPRPVPWPACPVHVHVHPASCSRRPDQPMSSGASASIRIREFPAGAQFLAPPGLIGHDRHGGRGIMIMIMWRRPVPHAPVRVHARTRMRARTAVYMALVFPIAEGPRPSLLPGQPRSFFSFLILRAALCGARAGSRSAADPGAWRTSAAAFFSRWGRRRTASRQRSPCFSESGVGGPGAAC